MRKDVELKMINGTTQLAGILGWPAAHSRSPLIHNYWIRKHGVDAAYVPLPVAPADFAGAVRSLPKLGFAGANVTVPHKQAAFLLADTRDALSERLGVVNTLVFAKDGSIEGRNTDVYGFLENLRVGAPGIDFAAGDAIVLGAGGAARAVVAGLLEAGSKKVRLLNRTESRAVAIAKDFADSRIVVGNWDRRETALGGAGLLINATSLGMEGAAPLELSLDALPKTAVVHDLVYAPLETGLLRAAREKGCASVDGLGMLLHQAVPAFNAWFGVYPDVTEDLRSMAIDDLARIP